jgi:hypothetical protein
MTLDLSALVVFTYACINLGLLLIDSQPHRMDSCAVLWLLVLLQTAKYGAIIVFGISALLADRVFEDPWALHFLFNCGVYLLLFLTISYPTLTLSTPGITMRAACSRGLHHAAYAFFALDCTVLAAFLFKGTSFVLRDIGPNQNLMYLLLP